MKKSKYEPYLTAAKTLSPTCVITQPFLASFAPTHTGSSSGTSLYMKQYTQTVKLCPFLLFWSKINLPPYQTATSFRNLTRNSLRSKGLKSYSMALKGTYINTSTEKTHSLYFIRLHFFFKVTWQTFKINKWTCSRGLRKVI